MNISNEDIIESARVRYVLAKPIIRKADYLGLLPDDDVPADEYDFEAFVIALSASADLPVEEIADAVGYVMGYFCGGDTARSPWSLNVASKLKEAWPKNDLGPNGGAETAAELIEGLDIDGIKAKWDEALVGTKTPSGMSISGVSRHFVVRASGMSAEHVFEMWGYQQNQE